MSHIRASLVAACGRLAVLPLVALLSGCVWSTDTVAVEVHNHTDVAIQARDATCWGGDMDDEVTIRAQSSACVPVGVFWYDADIEIEADGAWYIFDLDISPFEYDEALHVYADDVAPLGSG